MVSFPPCKINLGLHVTRKRPDGYHDIVTCFYPVPWCDVLEIVPSSSFTFASAGIPIPGSTTDNLCVRAYELLRRDRSLPPVAMYLLKIVPIGAGLGGGSSDGAHALALLNRIFELNLDADTLRGLAAELGSDCPFFVDARAAIGTGRGEILTPVQLSLKGKFIAIVKPALRIPTATAFSKIKPRTPEAELRKVLETQPIAHWKQLVRNDFEEPLFREFPVLEQIREQLYAQGALYAAMSGSGSALYGIFDRQTDLRKAFPDATVWSGFLD